MLKYLASKFKPMSVYSSSSLANKPINTEYFRLAKEVLIVSTDEFSSKRIVRHIDACYHKCIGVVNNFIKAERQIEKAKPDLILINMDLVGEFSGFETAKILDLEYNVPLVLFGAEKHLQMDYWVREIKPAAAIYLNTTDDELKEEIRQILD